MEFLISLIPKTNKHLRISLCGKVSIPLNLLTVEIDILAKEFPCVAHGTCTVPGVFYLYHLVSWWKPQAIGAKNTPLFNRIGASRNLGLYSICCRDTGLLQYRHVVVSWNRWFWILIGKDRLVKSIGSVQGCGLSGHDGYCWRTCPNPCRPLWQRWATASLVSSKGELQVLPSLVIYHI